MTTNAIKHSNRHDGTDIEYIKLNSDWSLADRDARYTKWKMAVQRSLGWATAKRSIAMTGQAKRKLSNTASNVSISYQQGNSPAPSRKGSLAEGGLEATEPPEDSDYVEELLKYSARKFSVFLPETLDQSTILDHSEYFMAKRECDYGMCECCPPKRRLPTDWETIEEIIENDPEIIFDSDDNPIVVERCGETLKGSVAKGIQGSKVPEVFQHICGKLSQTSLN